MYSVDHLRRMLSAQGLSFAGLVLAFFVMTSGLLWMADKAQPTYPAFSVISPSRDVPSLPSLPSIPTEREIAIAVALTALRLQTTSEETMSIYKSILTALVENRGKLDITKEEAPGVLRLKRSSGSYVD